MTDGSLMCTHKRLKERVQLLAETAARNTIIPLTPFTFLKYVEAAPRNYSFIILFIALKEVKSCTLCASKYEEFLTVAEFFKRSSEFKENKLYFGLADVDEDWEILGLKGARDHPLLQHFPHSRNLMIEDCFDAQAKTWDANTLGHWIENRTNVPVRIGGTLYYLKETYKNVTNDTVKRKATFALSVVATIFCLIMESGEIWVRMWLPELFKIHSDMKSMSFIDVRYFSSQYVWETYIILFMYTAVVIGLHLVFSACADVGGKRRGVRAFFGISLIYIFLGFLEHVLHLKLIEDIKMPMSEW